MLYLPTFSHFLIVNKASLFSLSLSSPNEVSLSLPSRDTRKPTRQIIRSPPITPAANDSPAADSSSPSLASAADNQLNCQLARRPPRCGCQSRMAAPQIGRRSVKEQYGVRIAFRDHGSACLSKSPREGGREEGRMGERERERGGESLATSN